MAALAVVGAVALASTVACDRGRADAVARPPAAEFLLGAGDSTYWVTSGATGVRVRSSPMLLARYGGRLYEVYAADDDRSYFDAVFVSQRIYRRDLVGGDSAPVFEDRVVSTLERGWAAAHPRATRLGPDEAESDDPQTVASTEVSLVDVHGPYLTYDAHDDLDVPGAIDRHATRRTVVDLRTARPATLDGLFGPEAASALAAAGRLELRRALDSVRALADGDDETGARALHALPSFRFASDNFGLAADGARPAVVFVSLGLDVDGHTVTLPLAPVPVPGPPPAWWTTDVRDALPSADSTELRWPLGGADLVVRPGPSADAAVLALRERPASTPGADRGRRRHEWPAGRVATPVRQLYALDRPPLDPESRRALARAFNESALYGGEATTASLERSDRHLRAQRAGSAAHALAARPRHVQAARGVGATAARRKFSTLCTSGALRSRGCRA